jgi:hypothetical protein
MTTLSITVDDSVAQTFRLGAKALSMRTEKIIASFLGQTVAGFQIMSFGFKAINLRESFTTGDITTGKKPNRWRATATGFLQHLGRRDRPWSMSPKSSKMRPVTNSKWF